MTTIGDATVTTYAGPGADTRVVQPAALVDVEVTAGGTALLPVPADWRAIVYVLGGEVEVGGALVADGQIAISDPARGDQLELLGRTDSRLLVFSGLPIGEPVVQHGPFVMNTIAEIDQAVSDYRAGRLAPTPTH